MIDEADLDAAIAAGVIDATVKARLLDLARERRGASDSLLSAPAAKFDFVHLLYYAGALLVMSAMGVFSTVAFSAMGGYALTITALVYALGFVALGQYLWRSPPLRIPGGLSIAVAVSMTPLAIYGIQDALNLWSDGAPGTYQSFFPLINASWVYMEAGTIVAAVVALRFFRFPFILLVAAIALWFMSMDLAALIAHRRVDSWEADWELRRHISIAFGLVMIAVAWTLDLKWARAGDFGFWLHLFGAIALWGGITASSEAAAIGEAIYCVFNIGFVCLAVFLNRRIYVVLGAIGISTYLGYLSFDVFKDVLSFSFALSAIGLAIIFAGILFQRRERAISAAIENHMPSALRALRPMRARLSAVS
jgi:hypothetical protein